MDFVVLILLYYTYIKVKRILILGGTCNELRLLRPLKF